MSKKENEILRTASLTYPFPIASACTKYTDSPPTDDWEEWGILSKEILPAVLIYLSHILLSDLSATGEKPAHLYYRIQSILSRPLNGHYVGFLRETARYYSEKQLSCAIPELTKFIASSEIECRIAGEGKPLLGLLVDYRNLYAHGKLENRSSQKEVVAKIRSLTVLLLENISFLNNYPLKTKEGVSLMGNKIEGIEKEAQPFLIIETGGIALRPLLLKLKGNDIALLEDFDISDKKITYKGSTSYNQFKKNDIKKGEGEKIFQALKDLLKKVRAEETLVEPDWEFFKERSQTITERTKSLYEDMGKYRPKLFVQRKEWHGDDGILSGFLNSDKTLLAINGVQGTGKSALAANMTSECSGEGHAVLFINAQRFTFANVIKTGENPFPDYFSGILNFKGKLDKEGIRRIVKTSEEGKKVILFIDAINEIDGIKAEWNRIEAMRYMLNWISSISQPGLKVVLTFRLEVYEEGGYLQDDEIPANIGEISYPGNNKSQPWVWDIEPFNEDQARQLYEKLQKEQEMGMSPRMSWDFIKEELGEDFESITDNPLIFTIFLRAHHLEEKIAERKRDAIFTRYAGKLTGSIEAAKRPWLKKVWEFIKNGNVTKKERFLADLMAKMSEEGNTAILLANEWKPKNNRDKRLYKTINSIEDTTVKDLCDGGILAVEEIGKESENILAKRISYTGELLVYPMKKIQEKLDILLQIRFFSVLTILLVSIPVFLLYFILAQVCIEVNMMHEHEKILLTGWLVFLAFFLSFSLALIWLVTIMDVYERKKKGNYKLYNIFYDGINDRADRIGLSFLGKISFPSFILLLILLINIYFNSDGYVLFGFSALGLIIFVFGVMLVSRIYRVWYLIPFGSIPPKIIKSSIDYQYKKANSKYYKTIEKRKLIFSFLSTLIIYFVFYFVHPNWEKLTDPIVPSINNSREFVSAATANTMLAGLSEASRDLETVKIIIVVIVIVLSSLVPFLNRRTVSLRKKLIMCKPKIVSKEYAQKILQISGIIFVLFTGYGGAYLYNTFTNPGDDLSIIKDLQLSSEDYELNEHNQLIQINLSGKSINQKIINRLYEYKNLTGLVLPSKNGYTGIIDFKNLPNLGNIHISDIPCINLHELTNLVNVGSSYPEVLMTGENNINEYVKTLMFWAGKNGFYPKRIFPNLFRIIPIGSNALSMIKIDKNENCNNLFILIGKRKNENQFQYLTEDVCKCIIESSPPSPIDNNLDKIKRWTIKGAIKIDFSTFKNLSQLTNLTLDLDIHKPDKLYFSNLLKAIKQEMPLLKELALNTEGGIILKGRDDIIKKLTALAEGEIIKKTN